MRHGIAIVLCAVIAGYCAYFYDVNVNPGNGSYSPFMFAAFAAFSGGVWAALIYPTMGFIWWRDVFLILSAFPVVGAATGLSFGLLGIAAGAFVAVTLPATSPWPIGVIYATAALLAWFLPRLGKSSQNTTSQED